MKVLAGEEGKPVMEAGIICGTEGVRHDSVLQRASGEWEGEDTRSLRGDGVEKKERAEGLRAVG